MKHLVAAFAAASLAVTPAVANDSENDGKREGMEYDVSALPGGVYEIDRGHAVISFSWSHFGFSEPWARFNEYESSLTLDPENFENSAVEVVIQTASLDSGVAALDEHMLSADMFDAEEFPVITFRSTSLERMSDTKGKLTGDLDMHGVTRPVTLDVRFNGSAPHFRSGVQILGFTAKADIKRSDWGIDYAVPAVSDEITLYITAEYQKAEE